MYTCKIQDGIEIQSCYNSVICVRRTAPMRSILVSYPMVRNDGVWTDLNRDSEVVPVLDLRNQQRNPAGHLHDKDTWMTSWIHGRAVTGVSALSDWISGWYVFLTHSDAGLFKTRDFRLHHVQQLHDLLVSFDEATHRTFTGKKKTNTLELN